MKIPTFLILCFASVAHAADFKAIDGKEYKNVTVSRLEPDGIVLITSSGISKFTSPNCRKRSRHVFITMPRRAPHTRRHKRPRRRPSESKRKNYNGNWPKTETNIRPHSNRSKTRQPVVANRGQPVEVISHGAQVDITKHLALGNVTIVDFYADWCGPCKQISPSLEQMARTDPEIALFILHLQSERRSLKKCSL
jgi:thiol-disulfide isomerase/thioredoxin